MTKRPPGNPKWVKGGASPNPSGKSREVRNDGWINTATGIGTMRDRRMHTTYGLDIVTDTEATYLWRTEWLCAKVIETRPKEAFRRGYEIDLGDKQKTEKLHAAAEELGVDEKVKQAIQYKIAYGGSALFPVLEGALGDLSEPLDLGAIVKVHALHVFEPRELQVEKYYDDIFNPKFRQPELYRVTPIASGRRGTLGVQTIHESRLIIFPGIRVSNQSQPGQREGWGDSELSRPFSLIRDLGMSIANATTILQNYGRDVLQLKGWAELAAEAGNDELMARRLSSFDMMNSALRMGVLDLEDKITTRGGGSLTGIEKVLETQAHFVAAACGIPISVLLDMAPGSLNATGDMNVRNWYASVENERESDYKPRLEAVFRLLIRSSEGPLGGKEPDVWSAKFKPLWTPSEKDTAETRKLDAERAKILIDSQVASSDDVAKSFYGGDTYSPELEIDWKAREEQKKVNEERAEHMDAAAVAAMGRGPAPADGAEPKPLEEAKQEPRDDEDGPGTERTFAGLPIVVEHKRGSKREHANGSVRMRNDYGYIAGAKGVDGDSVDVYLGRNETAEWVYVVHQMKAPEFAVYDEDKVMLGFDSPNHARDAYIAQYDEERFFGGMSIMSLEDFKAKLDAGGKLTNAEG